MSDWLRPFLMMFYAPARGMALVRDRAPLGGAALLALLAQGAQLVFGFWPLMSGVVGVAGISVATLLNTAGIMLVLAAVFVPSVIFFANLLERRGSFGLVLRQEYVAMLSCVFYILAFVSLIGVLFIALARFTGLPADFEATYREALNITLERGQVTPEMLRLMDDIRLVPTIFSYMFILPLFALCSWIGVREVFRLSWARAFLATLGGCVVIIIASPVLPLISVVLGSPFLLLLLFFVMRGYLGDVMRGQRARASFRQNLEAATLNPADASAHYNLGLLHLSRKEYGEATSRFRRAVEIDPDEVDSHYQLGRIARTEARLPEAIGHFGEVVTRDDAHAQHEVWREIGATYLAAGQFADAQDALQRFLDKRPSDPEALYLMGRASAGLGRVREAVEWMTACVEAVRTAPAYKYRADKRWLNEAQQFLRTQA
ncbi:MAG: tetratricopeptide repeat protein [Rubrivivax sp.]|nr:tetratricopeptide repeat protein [Pyrinomonadaceae bacterium]